MAYVAEGLGDLQDWDEVMKFQRKNGSLFNSPSTTAAALIHRYNDEALQYLNLLVSKFHGAVVDDLEQIGISQYFVCEIESILDMTYSCWLQKDEEIMMDIATCAMAFRLLRMNGYDVSSDELSHVAVAEASSFHNSLQGYLNDTKSLLELYRASKVGLSQNELMLDIIGSWSGNTLNDKLCSNGLQRTLTFVEVENALKFPFYATLERLQHKRNIEKFDARVSLIHKTGNLLYQANRDFHTLAVEDFIFSQSVYQDELRYLDRWHEHPEVRFYSEQVKIVFTAIYTTMNQLGAKASAAQGRDVTKHLREIWIELLKSMMTESEWQRNQYVPTVEEYMANAVISFALGPIVLPALYFVGERLSENVVKDEEYTELFRLMSTCGRLLNDTQGFEREGNEGKLNSVLLLVHHSGGSISVEAAKRALQNSIDTSRRDLLKLVLRKDGSVPRQCKELFWKMCKILHLFYFQTDGFSCQKEMMGAVNAVINEPLKL